MKNPSIQSPPVTDAESITVLDEMSLNTLPAECRDVVVIGTFFDVADKTEVAVPRRYRLTEDTMQLLRETVRVLRIGGLLFVYGIPRHLALVGEFSSSLQSETSRMIFKHWIALDIDDAPREHFLKPSHLGLLMFLKSSHRKKPSSFHWNKSRVRVPHQHCVACGEHLKNWGGKQPLMHDDGTVLSDVWRDLHRRAIRDCRIPLDILDRIHKLTSFAKVCSEYVEQDTPCVERVLPNDSVTSESQGSKSSSSVDPSLDSQKTIVCQGDSLGIMNLLKTLRPEGVFDMAFADPPYNLKKRYKGYSDTQAEPAYIEWCNTWLEGMCGLLKPGGSLFVLRVRA